MRCAVDLRSGSTTIERPTSLSAVEESLWNQRPSQALREGRLYQVVIDRTRTSKGGLTDRARVSLRELDCGTGELLRTIPVQEFRGDHECAGAHALTMKDGTLRFWVEFSMLE